MDGMDAVGVEEDALSERGLPRVNVCGYANISGGALLRMAVLCPLWQRCKCPAWVQYHFNMAISIPAFMQDESHNPTLRIAQWPQVMETRNIEHQFSEPSITSSFRIGKIACASRCIA